jgi:hypothetical protein
MKCHEFEDRLQNLLDDRQAPEADALLVEHAAGCDPCGQMLAGQRLLLAGLRRGVTQRPGSQLAQNALAGYQTEPMEAVVLDGSSAGRRAWQVLAWMAATAAALVIAVSIYVSSQPARRQIAAVPAPPETVRPTVPREGNPRPQVVQRAPTLGAFQFLPRRGYGVAIADMATSSLPEAVERIEDVERFAPGIRPIRVSFAMLWEALWRTIPGHGPSEPDPKALYGGLDSTRLA